MSDREKEYTPTRWLKLRLMVAAGLVVALFGVLSWRAWILQVREAERLKSMAEDQYMKDVELPPKRGRILDRNGAELAASAEVESVHVNARMLQAGERLTETSRALADALHLDRREVDRKLKARRYFTWIKRRITPEEGRAVRELQLPAVYLDKEPRRYYPNRGLAGPLLGWAGSRRRRTRGHRAAIRSLAARRARATAGPAGCARSRGAHRRDRERGEVGGSRPAHDHRSLHPISARARAGKRRLAASREGGRGGGARSAHRARCWPWRRCRRSIPTSPTAPAIAARAIAWSPIPSSPARP